ncbi:MAG TPA: ATP-binding cassette domain-containing protein [Bacteroidales bacterium]|nr:ATP-binding cassette domain-containing protein [Bacteroidales bacterium]
MVDKKENIAEKTSKVDIDVQDNVIEVRNLQKSFGDNHVLRDISLNLRRGENIVILGKSGIGKSVLIKCIVRLIYPDAGVVKVLDHSIPDLDDDELNELRKKVGYLFQGGALYDSMTVRENLAFPVRRTLISKNKNEVERMVREVLENVGLEEAIDKFPAELSGGMKKRIGLARTLILKPEIILYDEPTTGLDPVTSKEISELLLDIQTKYKTSSIIITHDIKCARMTANRIMVLRDGLFVAEGTYDELKQSDDKEVRAYFK